jgi:hypothetical protein
MVNQQKEGSCIHERGGQLVDIMRHIALFVAPDGPML